MGDNRHWEYTCPEEVFQQLKSDKRFLGLLTLARVVNALRFCMARTINSRDNGTPVKKRQTINGFLFANSVLYEGFLAVERLGQHLKDCKAFTTGFTPLFRHPDVQSLREDYLKRARNKFVFHFDKEVPEEIMDRFDLPAYKFATGIGPTSGEVYFNLADEVVINFLLPPEYGETDDALGKRHEAKIQEVTEVMVQFTTAAENLISEILPSMGWKLKVCE